MTVFQIFNGYVYVSGYQKWAYMRDLLPTPVEVDRPGNEQDCKNRKV